MPLKQMAFDRVPQDQMPTEPILLWQMLLK